MQPVEERLTYRPALDGVRAVAVLAVMLFHFKTKPLMPGGGIGVDVFFVLSGFLITTLLLQEWKAEGSISLLRFYQRRALRLLPAVGFFIAAYCLVAITLAGTVPTPPLERLGEHVASIATYSYNWLIAFDATRSPGLTHLWSLSVEEQFYLAWPACLVIMLKMPAPARMGLTVLLVAASAALPFLLDASPHRAYYGTDFRAQSLLWGSLLGQLYVAGLLTLLAERMAFRLTVAASTFFLAAFALFSADYGLATPVAMAAGLMVVGAVFQEGSVLSSRVLVYVGRRSYALYLWHGAFGAWVSSMDDAPATLLAFAGSFAAAELSYRLVERPALGLKARLGRRRERPHLFKR